MVYYIIQCRYMVEYNMKHMVLYSVVQNGMI